MRYADKYGYYELNPFNGSNQIVISNHAFIYPEFRGRGFGSEQHAERLRKAKYLGYNYIICTVIKENEIERHILRKNNWAFLSEFYNTESGNVVRLYGRQL